MGWEDDGNFEHQWKEMLMNTGVIGTCDLYMVHCTN